VLNVLLDQYSDDDSDYDDKQHRNWL